MDMAGALVLATSVMGLGAITFSALSLAFQRSHSRKSVRPFCNVLQRESENEMHISIQNAGMGPMRILKIVLLEHEGDSIQDGIPLEEAFSAEAASGVILHRLDGLCWRRCRRSICSGIQSSPQARERQAGSQAVCSGDILPLPTWTSTTMLTRRKKRCFFRNRSKAGDIRFANRLIARRTKPNAKGCLRKKKLSRQPILFGSIVDCFTDSAAWVSPGRRSAYSAGLCAPCAADAAA